MNYFLKDERVGLRKITLDDDLSNYVSWFNDQDVCAYNSHGVFPKDIKSIKNFLESLNESTLHLGFFNLETDEHIGNISLQNINFINRSAEFAILFGEKKFWGKGLAFNASRLIIDHGFKMLNLNRIYCGTNTNNKGMIKLAKKLGMKEEGRRLQAQFKNGEFSDILEFGLLKS